MKIILSISLLGLLLPFGVGSRAPQASTVVSVEYSTFTTQPMAVTGLYLNQQRILPLVPFDGYEGWVGDLRIQMKNTYNQPIRQIILHLNFPAKNPDGDYYLPSKAISRGKNYAVSRTPTDGSDELFLRPGEEITLRLSDKGHDRLLDRMRTLPPEALRRLDVQLKLVIFEDVNQGWGSGSYLRRDAKVEQRWRIEEGKLASAPASTKSVVRRVAFAASSTSSRALACTGLCYRSLGLTLGTQCKGAACPPPSQCTYIKDDLYTTSLPGFRILLLS